MGMFDEMSKTVTDRIIKECPFCKKILVPDIEEATLWQTKSFKNLLYIIDLKDINKDVFEMHHICPNCNKYISVNIDMISGDINIFDSNYNFSVCSKFIDMSLRDDWKNVQLSKFELKNNTTSFNLKNWLESNNVGYNKIEGNLSKDFYIIPKEVLEDFT